jgi:hypothetical protein
MTPASITSSIAQQPGTITGGGSMISAPSPYPGAFAGGAGGGYNPNLSMSAGAGAGGQSFVEGQSFTGGTTSALTSATPGGPASTNQPSAATGPATGTAPGGAAVAPTPHSESYVRSIINAKTAELAKWDAARKTDLGAQLNEKEHHLFQQQQAANQLKVCTVNAHMA